jgi:hypothetical protein
LAVAIAILFIWPFLKQKGLFAGGFTTPEPQKEADRLCLEWGGFSHWVARASNCQRSAECKDGIHYAHLGCV